MAYLARSRSLRIRTMQKAGICGSEQAARYVEYGEMEDLERPVRICFPG